MTLREPYPTTATPEGAAVVWRFDPWRERRPVALTATVCGLGLCVLVVSQRLPFLLAAALCLCCVASLAPAIAPVDCRVDAAGAARRGLLGWERRPWSVVRRIEAVRGGVLVSPFAHRRWLDATRAMLLPAPATCRDEMLAACRALWEAHAV